MSLLLAILLILLILFLAGGYWISNLVYILAVIALVVLIWQLLVGRRVP